MNILLNIDQINVEHVVLTEKKLNVIIEGQFSKIVYSSPRFMMDGLYILFPLTIDELNHVQNKSFGRFNPYSKSNLNLVKKVSQLEHDLIDYYRDFFMTFRGESGKKCKISTHALSKQLYSGNMKFFRDLSMDPLTKRGSPYTFVIKIAGIWESNTEVGITFRPMIL